ncbi:hypothetical protein GCM10009827_022080 [Dactylosporangium maewongense]|uniref:Secreted protein n=1 Tax=Dactylosporangium maewongense TaxID=634393 RepID=A0ABN1ZYI0_9ACTN
MQAWQFLAENNFGDTRSGGLAGPMGLLIIVLLAIATVLLIRNMTARIRRLPAEFPDPDKPATSSDDDRSDEGSDLESRH